MTTLATSSPIAPTGPGALRYAKPELLPGYPSLGLKKDDAAAFAAATLGWARQQQPRKEPPQAPKHHRRADSAVAANKAATAAKATAAPTSTTAPTSAAATSSVPTLSASSAAAVLSAEHRSMPPAPTLTSARAPSSAGDAEQGLRWSHQAALLAAGSAQRASKKPPAPPSNFGNSAANLAFSSAPNQASSNGASPRSAATLAPQGSLSAAKDAMAQSGSRSTAKARATGRTTTRPRAKSSPDKIVIPKETYPDQANAAANALAAATLAHRPKAAPSTPGVPHSPSASSSVATTGALPFTTMDRQMYTSHPLTEDKQHSNVLHASALAMAKHMYTHQQQIIDSAKQAHSSALAAAGTGGAWDSSAPASPAPAAGPGYGSVLQESAYRLAQERLAKLQDEHDKERDFQNYYYSPASGTGAGMAGAGGASSRGGTGAAAKLSQVGSTIRGKLTRRRSSMDDGLAELVVAKDALRSQDIRQQMSVFNSRLSEVDEAKRARDRAALLNAARRNVKAQLEGMDDKIAADSAAAAGSGKGGFLGSERLASGWEAKARATAQARIFRAGAGAHAHANYQASREGGGMYHADDEVDVGGGMVVDRERVNAVAAKNVQPLLEEIDDRVEKERVRRLRLAEEEERRKLEEEMKRAEEREVQENLRRLKEQEKEDEKTRMTEFKRVERAHREGVRAAKAEQKRLTRDEKQQKRAREKETGARAGDSLSQREEPAVVLDEAAPAAQPTVATAVAPSPPPNPMVRDRLNAATEKRSRAFSLGFPKLATKMTFKDTATAKDQEPDSAIAAVSTPTTPTKLQRHGPPRGYHHPSPMSDDAADPSSPSAKMRTWLRTRLGRPRANSSSASPVEPENGPHGVLLVSPTHKKSRSASGGDDASRGSKGSFIGGAALARARTQGPQEDDPMNGDGILDGDDGEGASDRVNDRSIDAYSASSSAGRPSAASMHEVALAGRHHEDGGRWRDVDGAGDVGSMGTSAGAPAEWGMITAASRQHKHKGAGHDDVSDLTDEGGGKSNHHHSRVSSNLSGSNSGSSSGPDRFVDARSGGGSRTSTRRPFTPPSLPPPRAATRTNGTGQPATATAVGPMVGMTLGKAGSPLRESRFAEILD